MKHSFLPPSGAHAWSKCALWPTMNEKFPDSNTAESAEGTAAHWVWAEMLEGRIVAEDTLSPNGVTVTVEMLEGAQLMVETVNAQVEGWETLHVETTVDISIISEKCFGTPDTWAYSWQTGFPGHLKITDYKFGHRFVDEWFNPQGLLYMAGIIGQLSRVPDLISFTIVQPRCFYKGAPVRTHTYRMEEATAYLTRLREAAERATLPEPPATTGAHCEHCPGRHACPTLQLAAYSDAETSTNQQPVELTAAAAALELRMLEPALVRLEARIEGLREQTTANLKAGKSVPHYKLEGTRGRRAWKIKPEEVAALHPKLTVPKVITPKQAELYLDKAIISANVEVIAGGLKLVQSNSSDAARVFKQET